MSEAEAQTKALSEHCAQTIAKGSLSFSLASQLFRPEARQAAHYVYAWCRHCDDEIDQVAGQDQTLQGERLALLRQKTLSAIRGEEQSEAVFQAFQFVVQRYRIPEHYPLELLEGMAMDVRRHVYQTEADLRLYCYRVASVVGLMMVHVMGISSEKALRHASDMGMAMQMTNIARDVLEDAQMGRVYFPAEWMQEAALSPDDVLNPAYRGKVFELTQRLLALAERHYQSGWSGISFLPFRAALAVAAAASIYAEIGKAVLRRGLQAWDSRTVVSFGRKIFLLCGAVIWVLWLLPKRILKPWSPAPIREIWRLT